MERTNWMAGVGMPIYQDHLNHMQNGLKSGLEQHIRGFIPPELTSYIVSGCEVNDLGLTVEVSSGIIVLYGEVHFVEAHTLPASIDFFWGPVTTYVDAADLVYKDGSSRKVMERIRAKLYPWTTGDPAGDETLNYLQVHPLRTPDYDIAALTLYDNDWQNVADPTQKLRVRRIIDKVEFAGRSINVTDVTPGATIFALPEHLAPSREIWLPITVIRPTTPISGYLTIDTFGNVTALKHSGESLATNDIIVWDGASYFV